MNTYHSVLMPSDSSQSEPPSAFSLPAKLSEPPKTLLVVDDDPIMRQLETHILRHHGYQVLQDPQTQAWNLYNARSALFMGYDDPRAVVAKGALVRQAGLAGVFAWELSQDNGDILNAMNYGVGNALLQP